MTTFYVDDVRVRLYSSPEPTVSSGLPPVNQPPTANNDSYSTGQDQPLIVAATSGVLVNDADPDGDALTAQLRTGTSHGNITLNADGSFSYQPAPGYTGTDSFAYRAFDGQAYSGAATTAIMVTLPQPPTAVNDAYNAYQNSTLTVPVSSGVLQNDTDPKGATLTAQFVTGPSHGTMSLNGNGSFTYLPANGYSGTDAFTYRAYNGSAYSTPATVTITVLATVGGGFNPQSWNYKRAITVSNAGGVLADYQVKVTLDASFDFVNAKTDGSDIVFPASDGVTQLPFWTESWTPTSSAIFWVRIPTVAAGSITIYLYYGNQNTTSGSNGIATFNFYDGFEVASGTPGLTNASNYLSLPTYDGSGQAISPSVLYFPNGWHSYKYWMAMTPLPNGVDTYRNPSILVSSDGTNWSVPTGVTNPVVTGGQNTEPDLFYNAATDEFWLYFVNETGAHTVKRTTSNDGIHWSTPQTLYSVPLYQNMSSTVAKVGDTYYLWTVNTGTVGCSSTSTPIQYRTSSDGINWSAAANISISGLAYIPFHVTVRQVPAKNEYWMLISGYASGANCGASVLLFAKSTDGINWTASPNVALNKSAGWDNALIHTSSLVYDPSADVLSVWYGAASTTGAYHIGYAQNQYTAFVNAISAPGPWTREGGGATLAQFTDQAKRGTYSGKFVEASGNGTSWWTKAQPLQNGFYQEWDLYDDLAQNAFKMVRVLNNSGNRVGIGVYTGQSTGYYSYHNTSYSYFTTSVARSVGWHKFGIRLTSDSAATLFVDGAQVGTVTGAFSNASKVDLEGLDTPLTTTFYVDDIRVRRYASPEPTASIGDEAPTDHAPVANDQAVGTNQDTGVPITLVATDQDNDPLTYSIVAGPSHGTLSGTLPSLTYSPNTGYYGDDAFTFKANDGKADSNTATVTITVNRVNHSPAAADQAVTTNEDTGKAVTLTAADMDNDTLTYSVVVGPAHGSLSGITPNLSYTPAAHYYGPDAFTFKANDGQVDSNVATVTITVVHVNHAPSATGDSYSTGAGVTLTVTAPGVLTNDSDPGAGDTLSAVLVTSTAHGILALNRNGSFTYTPTAGFAGNDGFTYRAVDLQGATSGDTTVSLTVVAPPPSVAPMGLTFPAIVVGAASGLQPVTVSNNSAVPLAITASITGDFLIAYNYCTATLNPGGHCYVYARFTPHAMGPLTGTLTINGVEVALSGSGVGVVTVNPAGLTFAALVVGQSSSSQAVTVVNKTGAGITLTPSITGDYVISYNYCTGTIGAGASCYVYVRFMPQSSGTLSGTLTLTPTGGASAATVSLSGTGVGMITATPTTLTFPALALGQQSSSQAVTVVNKTGAAITVTPTVSANFVLAYNYCTGTLAAGGQCYVYVRFVPQAAGALPGTLTLTPTGGASAVTVGLTGTGVGSILVDKTALTFPVIAVGQYSSSLPVKVTNNSGAAVTYAPAATTGDFVVAYNYCTGTQAASSSCYVYVRFTPKSAGMLTGTLTLNPSGPVSAPTVSLSGTGQ
jgi:predicted GH43/DUF377 family glycosyl hydrolase